MKKLLRKNQKTFVDDNPWYKRPEIVAVRVEDLPVAETCPFCEYPATYADGQYGCETCGAKGPKEINHDLALEKWNKPKKLMDEKGQNEIAEETVKEAHERLERLLQYVSDEFNRISEEEPDRDDMDFSWRVRERATREFIEEVKSGLNEIREELKI